MTLHDQIILELKKRPLSAFELSLLLNRPYQSITSRLSELRKEGYTIQLQLESIKRYHFISAPPTTADKILSWITDHNAYGKDIRFSILAKQLRLPESEIIKGYQQLFKTHRVIQTTNSSAKIM